MYELLWWNDCRNALYLDARTKLKNNNLTILPIENITKTDMKCGGKKIVETSAECNQRETLSFHGNFQFSFSLIRSESIFAV